ncbi:hypothetical protein BC830DRAFT_1137351 [Chytriomyces sp. MP71]|nr:hypothetical protein BC830DRAFT_1137351 [Chytriomyces sp. MP71]
MFRRLVRLSRTLLKGKLLFLANNIADAKYFEFKLGMPVPELKVIRPLGLTDYYGYPGDLPKPDPNVLAAQWHKTHIYGYLREEEGINMSMIPFGHHYGGPHNLLQFKGFVDIPYQYSTMKFYENVAAGVPLLMPSARFVMELGQSGLHQMPIFSPHILHVFSPNSSQVTVYDLEWARYVDYYSPEFEPFVYFFDNYSELRRLSLLPRDEMDSKHVRVKGPAFYIEFRRELYRMWEEVLLAGYSYWG